MRAKIEQEPQERENICCKLFNLIEQAIQICELVLDEKGEPIDAIILNVNPAFEKHSGLRREQVTGRHIKEVLPVVEQIWLERYAEVTRSGKEAHFEEFNASLEKWLEVSASPIVGNRFVAVFKDITERKKKEALCEAEENFRTLFNSIDEGFCLVEVIFDDKGKPVDLLMLDYNSAFEQQTGITFDTKGKTVRSVFSKYKDQRIADIGKVALTGNPAHFENYDQLLNRWYSGFAFSIGGERSNLVALIFNDVSKSKQAEEALKKAKETLEEKVKERTSELEKAYYSLKESENSLAEAQKMAHLGNWSRNLRSGEVHWSDEVYRIFGFEPQERGVNYDLFLSCVHPDDKDHVIKGAKQALENKLSSIDYKIVLDNGEERTVHEDIKVVFNEENTPVQLRGTIQDITERKKAEEKLRVSEEKYRNIIETANEGIGIIDNEFKLTFVNKRLEDMIGYRAEEIVGTPLWFFLGEDSKHNVNLILERGLQDFENPELKFIRKDGSHFWAQVNAKPIFDSHGKFISITTMLSDITKRKEAEESLAKIEIARKQEIHHRIKNNLQVISSLLDLQAEQFKDREDIRDSEVLEAIRESQDRVISMALIHEELYKGGGLETLNFSQYIEELAANLLQTYNVQNNDISLRFDLVENAFFDMDTAVPLGIIINELVANSLKHAFIGRDRGEIRIKLRRDEEDKREGSKIISFTLTISDNGVCIPENLDIENLDSLGMQLVTSLVDQLDGEFELKRKNGTEFIMRFTVTECEGWDSNPRIPS